MSNKYISVDIGGTNVKFAELDRAGHIITKDKVSTLTNKEDFLESIDDIVSQFEGKDIRGISFCAPGKIEHTKIRFGGSLPFLDGVDFAQRYKKLGIPVAVINDGKASVLAENWLGSLKDLNNCAAITLGTEVGGGIIVNGRLLNGVHFQAGEISFLQLNIDKPGYDGLAASYASAVRMIIEVNTAIGNADKKDGLVAFRAIKRGDPKAVKIFNEFCRRIAYIILDIQTVVDLDRIAIGGGISAQSIVAKEINNAYDQILDQLPLVKTTLTRPKIVDAKFKNSANLYGALYNLLLHMNNEKL